MGTNERGSDRQACDAHSMNIKSLASKRPCRSFARSCAMPSSSPADSTRDSSRDFRNDKSCDAPPDDPRRDDMALIAAAIHYVDLQKQLSVNRDGGDQLQNRWKMSGRAAANKSTQCRRQTRDSSRHWRMIKLQSGHEWKTARHQTRAKRRRSVTADVDGRVL